MVFERYVCWDPARGDAVLHIEAEKVPASIFSAVHTEEALSARKTTAPVGSPREFLDAFLAPVERDIRAVVIGEAGTGKSHLVQWVEFNLPDRDDLRVVSVPRSQTSLRSILELLIRELPLDAQRPYREKLVSAPDSAADFAELERRLIAELGIAIGKTEPTDEVDEALRGGLQDFLDDPHLRQFHVGEAGIISELVRHIAQVSRRDERDARRRFEEADLLLDQATRLRDELSLPARKFLSVLRVPEHRSRAVGLLNEHLDAAVTNTLGLSGGDLTDLLNEVRRYLRSEGQQLVLFIQDLVRAEGIDRALLDALIESDPELCQLRLLVAVTTGRFETDIGETHKQRIEFVIDMDQRPALDEEGRLPSFAARYLNAMRVDSAELDGWFNGRLAGDDAPLPNACLSCRHREPCHAAFGSRDVDGAGPVGLYPFTADAFRNIAQRASDASRGTGFKFGPRQLLSSALVPILSDLRARAIRAGEFPDQALVEGFGGLRLPIEIRAAIRAEAGADTERQLALLALWSAAPGSLTQLPEGLHRAFALAPLSVAEGTPRTFDGVLDPGVSRITPEPEDHAETDVLRRTLNAVEVWANGGPMTRITNDLRKLVASAVSEFVDWDGEGLERSVFAAGGSRAWSFQNPSIDFALQDTTPSSSRVKLKLPPEDTPESLLATARALQGLASFDRYKHWEFENGPEQFLVLSEELPKWAGIVVQQLHELADPEGEWDPVASAVEVLAIGATLASRPARLDASVLDREEALFGAWPEPGELQVRSGGWRELYSQIHRRLEELRGIVLAHAGAMKGGRKGSMLDGVRVVEPLRVLNRTWQLAAVPPPRLAEEELPDRYAHLVELHADLRARLDDVVGEERDARLAWLNGVRLDLPEGAGRLELVKSVQESRDAVLEFGLAVSIRVNRELGEELESFARVQLDEAVRLTEELRDIDGEQGKLLPRMAAGRRGEAMEAADRFLPIARAFLDEAESKYISDRERTTGADEIEAQFTSIRGSLEAIEADLLTLEGGDA